MAVQRTQRNDKTASTSNVVLLVAFIVVYVIASFTIAFVFSTTIQNYLMACVLSFASIGIASYFGMHFVLPDEMVRIDTRLLHEFARRKLVEFRSIEEETSLLK